METPAPMEKKKKKKKDKVILGFGENTMIQIIKQYYIYLQLGARILIYYNNQIP